MDLRVYYTKVREAAAKIPGEFAVLLSHETPDGGKPGVMSEVLKAVAARMLVEGRARLATTDESTEFYRQESAMRAKAELASAPPRLQVAVLSEKDLESLKAGRPGRSSEGSK